MLEKLKTKLAQLSEEAKQTSEAISTAVIMATESERNERMDICKQCPHLYAPTTSCKKCGCFMVGKTWLSNASCPIGKWKAIPIKKESE